jgi:AhpD family alkylhydroperoxidase
MDWFWRPTATPDRLVPWLTELRDTAAGLFDAFRPGHPSLSPHSRERIALTVTEINGCRPAAWVHEAWAAFLGDYDGDETLPVLIEFARESAITGRPIDESILARHLDADGVRAVRATVAVAELASLVGNTADGLWHRLTFRRPFDPAAALREAVVVAAALPLAAPMFLAAGAMRLATMAAPPLPEVAEPDDDANLVVHLLAEAVPALLSNALARAMVLRLPNPLVVGVRAEDASATVRISRDQIELANGLDEGASVVIDGGLELLLEVAGRALGREINALGARRP